MKKQYYHFLFFFVVFFTPLHSFSFWKSNAEKEPEKLIKSLQKKQVDDPNNPLLNYNLGVAFYKTGKYVEAESSFERALTSCNNQKLKTQCMFNLGNSLYKQTIATLPFNWELKDDIDQATIDQAISLTQKAIQQYNNILALNKDNLQAKTNVKKAEELLQKLTEKKKQQEKNQDKKQKSEQKNKEEKEQQQDQKTNEKKQDHNKESSQQSSNEEKDKNAQQGKEDKQEQQGKEGANKFDQKSNQGDNNELNNQQQKDNPQQDTQGNTHNQPHEEKNAKEEQHQQQVMQSGQQKQESAKEGGQTQAATDSEMRNMQAILNNLQEDESKTQKAFITRELKKNTHQSQSNQKPW